MIVLGIDPGYALMGWGVVEAEGSRMRLINYGCIETKEKTAQRCHEGDPKHITFHLYNLYLIRSIM